MKNSVLFKMPKGPLNPSTYSSHRDPTYRMLEILPIGSPTASDVVLSDWRQTTVSGNTVWEHVYLSLEIREDVRGPNSTYYLPWIVQDPTRQNPTDDLPYLVLGTMPVGDIVFQSLFDAIRFTIAKFTNSHVRLR